MSLIKVAANRMTKELMHGRLSEEARLKIVNTADNERWSNSGDGTSSLLRSREQMAAGMDRGNETRAKKIGFNRVDNSRKLFGMRLPSTDSYMIGELEGSLKSHMRSLGSLAGIPIAPKTIYAPAGRDITLQNAHIARHEIFEAEEAARNGAMSYKKLLSGDMTPIIKYHGSFVGSHMNPAVLGQESNEVARSFYKENLDGFLNGRKVSGESAIGAAFGKEYGKHTLNKKELNILRNIAPTKKLIYRYHDISNGFQNGVNHNPRIAAGVAGAVGLTGAGLLARKLYKNHQQKERYELN